MKNVALIINRPGTAQKNIAQTLAAIKLFDRVVGCETEQQATDVLRQYSVDMIFCPFPKSRSCFSDLLHSLKEREEWRDIPLLLFSSEHKIDRINALELGASDCLPLNLPTREAAVQIGWHLKNKHRIEQLRRSQIDLARKAVTDGLTGLYNRGYFDADLTQQIALTRRTERPLTLMLADLDHFKNVNDTYGHQAGDRALQGFARLLKESARESDIVCRYGGEEFAIILPQCDSSQAFRAAERLRNKVAEHDFGFPLTISIGLASATAASWCNAAQLLEKADIALYSAKEKGRNRSEIYPELSVSAMQAQGGHQRVGINQRATLSLGHRRSLAALRKTKGTPAPETLHHFVTEAP